jgi:TPP-dependent pyruvate/acetoin dehydrogenase alpha subunit
VATGAALAFKQEASDRVCVCSFGDGTSNRGDFHENLNLAALWRLPIVYVCQNNGWAISQRTSTYLPAPVAARAAGYGMPGETIDGHDVEAVRAAVGLAIARARRGDGPTLIEAMNSRRRGHWAAQSLTEEERAAAAHTPDPLALFEERLIARAHATSSELEEIRARIDAEIAAAVERATSAPDPGDGELGSGEVFAS